MVVHRLLAATLNLTRLPEDAKNGDRLHVLAANLNLRHRRVALLGISVCTCTHAVHCCTAWASEQFISKQISLSGHTVSDNTEQSRRLF